MYCAFLRKDADNVGSSKPQRSLPESTKSPKYSDSSTVVTVRRASTHETGRDTSWSELVRAGLSFLMNLPSFIGLKYM